MRRRFRGVPVRGLLPTLSAGMKDKWVVKGRKGPVRSSECCGPPIDTALKTVGKAPWGDATCSLTS